MCSGLALLSSRHLLLWFLGPWGQTLSFIGLSFVSLLFFFASLAIFSFLYFIKVAHIAHLIHRLLPRPPLPCGYVSAFVLHLTIFFRMTFSATESRKKRGER